MTALAASATDARPPEPFAVERVQRCPALLGEFNAAGVLDPADVHVALTLGRLGDETDDAVLLAVALAVRATRLSSVCVDLATVAQQAVAEGAPLEPQALAWPPIADWLPALGASPLVTAAPDDDGSGSGGADARVRPLLLAGTRLYLDRYWRYEQRVLRQLLAHNRAAEEVVDLALLRDGLDRLFPRQQHGERPDRQRLAAACVVLRGLTVVAGGPGTGKTTTIGRVLALLDEQASAAGQRPPQVALAAPTGKAAARLEESLRHTAGGLDVAEPVRDRLRALRAVTLHRLLGRQRGSQSRFRHDLHQPLPHDVIVVDETSMVSLALTAKLLEAVRPDARLVLLGDPEQLASVEAGAVLGDIVGVAKDSPQLGPDARRRLGDATGEELPAGPQARRSAEAAGAIGDGIVVLRHVHRFRHDSGIAALAEAIQRGDADGAVALLESGLDDVVWLTAPEAAVGDAPADGVDLLERIRKPVVAVGRRMVAAAREGDAEGALQALEGFRLLCAHRRGPLGVAAVVPLVQTWLTGSPATSPADLWAVGRPIMATANDYQVRVFNGDSGVMIADSDGAPVVALRSPEGVRRISPIRLEGLETLHAMTVHKSQGSQFADVIVVLPRAGSPLLTRELLYTAVTRAQQTLTLAGTAEAVRAAVSQPIQRSSGLGRALWGEGAH